MQLPFPVSFPPEDNSKKDVPSLPSGREACYWPGPGTMKRLVPSCSVPQAPGEIMEDQTKRVAKGLFSLNLYRIH